jgi:hypothetical protein
LIHDYSNDKLLSNIYSPFYEKWTDRKKGVMSQITTVRNEGCDMGIDSGDIKGIIW